MTPAEFQEFQTAFKAEFEVRLEKLLKTWGTAGTDGILAPEQGVFRKPDDPKEVSKADVDENMLHAGGGARGTGDSVGLHDAARSFKVRPGTINPYEALLLPPGDTMKAALERRAQRQQDEPLEDQPVKYPQLPPDMGYFDVFYSEASIFKAKDVIAIDFDGTCTIDEKMTPNPDMLGFIEALQDRGMVVVIFSARPADEIKPWLEENEWPDLEVTNIKSPDFKVFLDDRAASFHPMLFDNPEYIDQLAEFTTWWEDVNKSVNKSVNKDLRLGVQFEDTDDDGVTKRVETIGFTNDRKMVYRDVTDGEAFIWHNGLWKVFDESKHPRGADGKFGSGVGTITPDTPDDDVKAAVEQVGARFDGFKSPGAGFPKMVWWTHPETGSSGAWRVKPDQPLTADYMREDLDRHLRAHGKEPKAASEVLKAAAKDCEWRTINGTPVCIDGKGNITAGPKALVGYKSGKLPNYNGRPKETKTKMSKQQTGDLAEQLVTTKLFKGAKRLGLSKEFKAFDILHGNTLIEVKGGQISNGRTAQQWRLTIGEPGKAEKKYINSLSETEKEKYHNDKAKRIQKRKNEMVKRLERKLGKKLKVKTVTMIVDPDKKIADYYEFDGVHDRIGWNSDKAKSGFKGSVKF